MFGIQNLLNTEQQCKACPKILPTKRQSCHSRICWTLPHTNLGHLHMQTHRMSSTGFETGLHVDLRQHQQLGHLCLIFSQIPWPSMPQNISRMGRFCCGPTLDENENLFGSLQTWWKVVLRTGDESRTDTVRGIFLLASC